MESRPRTWLTSLGVLTSHPIAFIAVGLFAVAWLISSPDSFGWHGLATVGTLFMTLLIQRAEHRDTQAIHAKLDELLKADGKARNELMQIDQREAEEIEQHRERTQVTR
jgi:low affinity Fe/Cu permease